MRYFIYIYFLVSFLGCSRSNNDFIGKPIIAATKMNILYFGMENPIGIGLPNYPCKDLVVSVSNGTIKGDGCDYSIIPINLGSLFISVLKIADSDTTVVGTIEFIVKNLPIPNASFCFHSKRIEKNEVLNCKGLELFMDGFDWECPYIISKFDFVIVHEECRKEHWVLTDAKFSNEIMKAFRELEPGDRIICENIQVVNPDIKYLQEFDPETHEKVDTNLPSKPILINDLKLIIF